MKRSDVRMEEDEPIGIVISSGWRRDEPAPTFSAYIYGDAPADDASEVEVELEPVTK